MSAQAFLFGFYPAEGSFEWLEGNFWQPVPVHATTPGEPDLLLKPTSTVCDLVKNRIKQQHEEQAKYFDIKYADLFDLLSEESGIANFSYNNMGKLSGVQLEHEGTLLSLMYAMGVANDRLVPFASSIIMEIFKDGSDYYVELLYRNDTTTPPYLLEIEGCQPCTVQKLLKRYGSVVVESYCQQQMLCGTPVQNCNGSPVSML
ncbi:hypothetical protein DICVIV_13727 [Dictyocaulus viviparus]|uniref:Uncharacterized protein n=1 Tax=Dictyocaulus viviparus TaxID=29172 RepID=A0A0D8X739_DICVI|nr:hypothetical protein DICVIV_13727 [Dictyocaulus viviparus]